MALAGLLLMLLAAGCGRGTGVPETRPAPRTVTVPGPELTLELESLPDGAELALLQSSEPIQLEAGAAFPSGGLPDGIERTDADCYLMVEKVSPPGRRKTKPLSALPARIQWEFDEGEGHYRCWLECLETFRTRGSLRIAGAEVFASQTLRRSRSDALHVQVPVASTELVDGDLLGVQIGHYLDPMAPSAPESVRAHANLYRCPDYFYRVDDTNRNLLISKTFRLQDFDLTFEYWAPGYDVPYEMIALDYRVVRKLEDLLEALQREALPDARLEILAGFRSPWYNESVKRADMEFSQTSKYSTHMYGRAVDFIVDSDGDGVMDDLNGDGVVDLQDCRFLERFADWIDQRETEGDTTLLGGFGIYPRHDIAARAVQTPYVHMDVRGYLNPQGKPPRWYMP